MRLRGLHIHRRIQAAALQPRLDLIKWSRRLQPIHGQQAHDATMRNRVATPS